MKLIIDIGNTNIKLALFNQDFLIEKKSIGKDDFINQTESFLAEFNQVEQVIISSVGKLTNKQLNFLEENFKVFHINQNTKLPFQNLYGTPKTLGVDRIALAAGAIKKYPHKNVLIIDAGTCVTYDIITKENNYLGGAISPGLYLRYKSLNDYTANLPRLDIKVPEHFIGQNTNESIHTGVVLGLVNEIDGTINTHRKHYSDLTVILTGGDANFLSDQLKNSIFAHSNLLVEGLNFIFEFNHI